ncbi:MAG: UvrD-helicase domain-containing protein [Victivallales bacterium]|nr:UvrD-helicase domain-containing protein [Victivallales bacterium]
MENNNFSSEIINPDFKVAEGLHLIEASAGTGKTYSIQSIYARLVMETDFRVANILVMTFTEAATKELKERLRTVLLDLQKLLRGETECDGKDEKERANRTTRAEALIKCVCSSGNEQGNIDRKSLACKRVELALLEFDGAAISTIHGFCQRVLSRYAFETGMSFSQEIVDNKDAELKAAAVDWWRVHHEIPLKELVKYCKVLGDKAGYTIAPTTAEVKRTLDCVEKIEARRPSQEGENSRFRQLKNTLQDVLESKININDMDLEPLLDFLQDAINAKVKGVTNESKALHKIWSGFKFLKTPDEIVTKYESLRPEREALTFDDLPRGLRDALRDKAHGTDLAEKLRAEYQAALIDEFQDTDPVQYEIFRKIFIECEKPGPLYFVGDPKQAIYAFRGGDIFTYFNAKSLNGLKNHILTYNRRSIKKLVNTVNDMFGGDNTFGEEIRYVNSDVPEGEKEQPEIKGEPLPCPLQIIKFVTDDKPSKAKYMSCIMDRMTDEILALLAKTDEKGKAIFSPKDIAILMGSKTNMPDLQKKLLAKGIPSVMRDSGSVFQTSIAYELRAFLLAVTKADSPRADEVRAAMLTVFGGMSFDEVESLDEPNTFADAAAMLKSLKGIWDAKGFAAMACRLEKNGYMLRLAHHPDGRRQLSDIGQILELCGSATKQVGSAPEAMVDWLTERIRAASNGEETDAEEFARELETDGEAVKIMTIHASKGLQFPIVFLPDCWLINPSMRREKNFYHGKGDDGTYELHFSKTAVERAEMESTSEKIRLLYVALTRAKQQTVLFAPSTWPNGEPLENLLKMLPDDHAGGENYEWISWEQPETYVGKNEPFKASTQEGDPVVAQTPRTDWDLSSVRGSYSSLAPGHVTGDDDSRDNDEMPFEEDNRGGKNPPEDILDLPAGARVGNCWHNILEHLPFDADAETIRQMTRAELQANGFDTDEMTLGLTVKMLEDTLNHPLQSPTGKVFSLRDIGWGDRLSEQEFDFSSAQAEKTTSALKAVLQKHWSNDATRREFVMAMKNWDRIIPKGYLKGFMDLVFRHNGFYYVVDWKSNTLDRDIANFTEEGLRAEMAKHGYFFQYILYSAVLHSYLKQCLGEKYSYERHFGGVRYYFLRGQGKGQMSVFEDRPEEALLDDFAKALGMEVK